MSISKRRKVKKKGKLPYEESYKKSRLIDYVITIDVLTCVFGGLLSYIFVFRKILSWLQLKLFTNSSSIIFTPSSDLWLTLEYTSSILFISALLIYISFHFINKTKLKSFRTQNTDKKGTKSFFIYFSPNPTVFYTVIKITSFCILYSFRIQYKPMFKGKQK
jgi:hypothetical protein